MGDVVGEASWAARAEAIEGFARVLSDLRESAGRPSFRVMAGRSKVISHTTLHEAVHGNRLPSWGTTVEFVKACGADPAAYREQWECAARSAGCVARVVVPSGPGPALPLVGEPLAGPVPTAPTPALAADQPGSAAEGAAAGASPATGAGTTGTQRRRRRTLTGLVAAAVLASAGGLAWSVVGHAEPPAPPAPAPVARDCPVHQANPPAAAPAHAGDRAAFVADVTLPDCSHVTHGSRTTKVWRLKNAGSVAWTGYALHRVDLPQRRDQCQTISDVPVADTAPGRMVDIEVEVTAPPAPGFCFVRFKLVDASGHVAFPGSRPLNFQVVVD